MEKFESKRREGENSKEGVWSEEEMKHLLQRQNNEITTHLVAANTSESKICKKRLDYCSSHSD